jgi:FKBP-type peptidyl-prolyl cis-trans isomerase FkpA
MTVVNDIVTFTKIPENTIDSLKSIKKVYASELATPKTFMIDGVLHRYYVIRLKEGTQLTPTKVDQVFASYRGSLMDDANTTFDQSQTPVSFGLDRVIRGWSEIFPQFKSGTFSEGVGGVINYANYGAGVMFIPSAMGYYNQGSGAIPAYAPLIFSFTLKHVKYIDHDLDGILSKDELYAQGKETYDDTDGDGRPDYVDQDDDGDNFLTSFELKNPAGGSYTFDNVPLCSDGKKRHLSKICHE